MWQLRALPTLSSNPFVQRLLTNMCSNWIAWLMTRFTYWGIIKLLKPESIYKLLLPNPVLPNLEKSAQIQWHGLATPKTRFIVPDLVLLGFYCMAPPLNYDSSWNSSNPVKKWFFGSHWIFSQMKKSSPTCLIFLQHLSLWQKLKNQPSWKVRFAHVFKPQWS